MNRFHQLITLVTDGIDASGEYSIELHSDESMQHLVAHFWVDTFLQHACIAAVPRSLSFPATLFEHLSGLVSLLSERTPIVSIIGANTQICTALIDYLSLPSITMSIPSFRPDELARCLLSPSVKILARFDINTILDYILAKLQSARREDWISKQPALMKVCTQHNTHVVNFLQVNSEWNWGSS